MEDEERSFARLGLVGTFLEIAVDSYNNYMKIKDEIKAIEEDGGEWHDGVFFYKRMTEHFETCNKLRKETIIIVLFLATFLESYIYDLASIVLGDSFAKEHLDKLSITSKWIVIPKLITGKEIDKSKSFFGEFKNLVKWRNDIIHHKSKDANTYLFTNDEEKISKLKPIYELVNVDLYFKMLNELFIDLDRIDKQGLHLSRINMNMKKINKKAMQHSI